MQRAGDSEIESDGVGRDEAYENAIAIVGMAIRVPGANNVDDYWNNLTAGRECLTTLDDETLLRNGVSAALVDDPRYVKRAALLDGVRLFDAGFFGVNAKEAAVMDPQHRHFLETCWEALEHAGHIPGTFTGPIGVFAGSGMHTYFATHLLNNPELMRSMGLFLVRHTGNDKDFLSTRASYCLNLTGPSLNVQTACSTSLVAVHLAAQSLLSGECELALAGGVTIELPHGHGYLYEPGEILSPDGHCRAFDHKSAGTVFGSGAGVVVLRRLADAIADHDIIHAVIRGSAINNDGAGKVGYLAPGVDGQANAIAEALVVAGIDADSIDYIECHGTGTPIGDPIEVAALTRAFAAHRPRGSDSRGSHRCALGSVKTNIGHLDTAAGVASLIKVACMLSHAELVPTLHFEAPNPGLQLENGPFFVNTERRPWPKGSTPRRAGVSALGVGGTNAHVILEEPPAGSLFRTPTSVRHAETAEALLISARTPTALNGNLDRLRQFFAGEALATRDRESDTFGNAVYTLGVGRRAFAERAVVVARSASEAAAKLSDSRAVVRGRVLEDDLRVHLLFPGGGAQYPAMARGLAAQFPKFRDLLHEGMALAKRNHGLDLEPWLLQPAVEHANDAEAMANPVIALVAILLVEVAVARQLEAWSVRIDAMLGHSLGEYAAAHLAGVFSFEDAIAIVHKRGQLFNELPEGGMLNITATPKQSAELAAKHGLDLAAHNAPDLSVLSGPIAKIVALEAELLAADQVSGEVSGSRCDATRLRINVAAHSAMLDPILEPFRQFLQTVRWSQPTRPFVSNLTGTWADSSVATPDYWVAHLRGTVRFAEGLATLLRRGPAALLEVGPGTTLISLAAMHPERTVSSHPLANALRHPSDQTDDVEVLLTALGKLWTQGVNINWSLVRGGHGQRIPLPTYAFDHAPYWIAPSSARVLEDSVRSDDVATWATRRVFKRQLALPPTHLPAGPCLVAYQAGQPSERLADAMESAGATVVRLAIVHSSTAADFERFFAAHGDRTPRTIAYLAPIDDAGDFAGDTRLCFNVVLDLLKAVANADLPVTRLLLVSHLGIAEREGVAQDPTRALLQGPLRVAPKELDIEMGQLDLPRPERHGEWLDRARVVLDQLGRPEKPHERAAWRSDGLWVEALQRVPLPRSPLPPTAGANGIPQGPAVIIGGLGGIGLTIAKYLADRGVTRIALWSRSSLPDETTWPALRASQPHDSPLLVRLAALEDLQARGVEVHVQRVDVALSSSIQQALADLRHGWGEPATVIHAAGTLDDAPILTKTNEACARVLGPKVAGARALVEALEAAPPQLLMLFSSTSEMIGTAGQVDYVAANAYLSALGQHTQLRWPHTRVRVIAWGLWQGVGMAVRAAYPEPPVARGEPVAHPLLQFRQGGRCTATLRCRDHWVVDEHRLRKGSAVMPGSGIVELIRAAADLMLARNPLVDGITIEDLRFLEPCLVQDHGWTQLHSEVSPDTGHGTIFRAWGGADDWQHDDARVYAEARVCLVSRDRGAALDLHAIQARVTPNTAPLRQLKYCDFGPRWNCVVDRAFGVGEALVHLRLPAEYHADLATYQAHPALLDMLSGAAFDLLDAPAAGAIYVPISYDAITWRAPLTPDIYSHVRRRSGNQLDITVTDAAGEILAEITGYTLRALPVASFAIQPARSSWVSPQIAALQSRLRDGILPHEGQEVFERVVTSTTSPGPWFISPVSLHDAIRQARPQPAADTLAPQAAAHSDSAAPRDDVEAALFEIWHDLLGTRVRLSDNFFELGGHSLIAVRLFSKLKKRFGVELSLSTLLEAPTLDACAGKVRIAMGRPANPPSSSSTPSASEVEPSRAWSPLVRIATGDGSRPFYCVHGAGGNVLNFRALSEAMGAAQTFYGFQAQGVDGRQPLATIEAMAESYITALNAHQPAGPVFLGGYSGGGVIAIEMAHRLRAQGRDVPLVVLLDSFAPEIRLRPLSRAARIDRLARSPLRNWPKVAVAGVAFRVASGWENLRFAIARRRRRPVPVEMRERLLTEAYLRAADAYDPAPYHGRVVLYRAREAESSVAHAGPQLGWQNRLTNMEIYEVDGGHNSFVLAPQVHRLAAALKANLEQA